MNKEMAPLEALDDMLEYLLTYDEFNEKRHKDNVNIIETAIKDYDDIKHICNQYNIEFSLSNIREALFTFAQLKGEHGTNWNNYNKKLKALEIIKKKMVNLDDLNDAIYEDNYHQNNEHNAIDIYNQNRFEYKHLTQDEIDLLKEVLL